MRNKAECGCSVRKRKVSSARQGPVRVRVSQISPSSTQVPSHGKSVGIRFEHDFDFKSSSETRTIPTTPFSLLRDVCIRSNMPWRP